MYNIHGFIVIDWTEQSAPTPEFNNQPVELDNSHSLFYRQGTVDKVDLIFFPINFSLIKAYENKM